MINELNLGTDNLYLGMNINGDKGPFDNKTPVGRGANAGYQVTDLLKKGEYDKLEFATIEYMPKFPDGKYSVDAALAFSRESLKAIDKDLNGHITKDEFNLTQESTQEQVLPQNLKQRLSGILDKIFDVIDINNDGKVDNAENTAYTVFQDSCKEEFNGKTTHASRLLADKMILMKTDYAKEKLRELHNGHNLAQKDAILKY